MATASSWGANGMQEGGIKVYLISTINESTFASYLTPGSCVIDAVPSHLYPQGSRAGFTATPKKNFKNSELTDSPEKLCPASTVSVQCLSSWRSLTLEQESHRKVADSRTPSSQRRVPGLLRSTVPPQDHTYEECHGQVPENY